MASLMRTSLTWTFAGLSTDSHTDNATSSGFSILSLFSVQFLKRSMKRLSFVKSSHLGRQAQIWWNQLDFFRHLTSIGGLSNWEFRKCVFHQIPISFISHYSSIGQSTVPSRFQLQKFLPSVQTNPGKIFVSLTWIKTKIARRKQTR